MKSLEELQKIREQALKKVDMRNTDKDYRIVVGMATCGIAAGARPVLNALVEQVAQKHYNCIVTQTGCIGLCVYEPIIEVFDKLGNHTTYVHMDPAKAIRVLDEHIANGTVIEEYTIGYQKGERI